MLSLFLLRREDESGCNAAEVLCLCVCVRSKKQREIERELETEFNVKETILPNELISYKELV